MASVAMRYFRSLLLCAALGLPAVALEKWTVDEILKTPRLEGAAISPDGRYVVYGMTVLSVAENRRLFDLYVAAADGSGTRRLTGDGHPKLSPGWSPDSRRVCYLADDAAGRKQVWCAAPDGAGPEQITFSPLEVRSFVWSPDASRLLYVAAEPDSPDKLAHQKEWGVVISPEESWPERGRLWLLIPGTREARRLTDGSALPAAPQWSPDGRLAAFLHGRPAQIHVLGASGSSPPRAVTRASPGVIFFAWSPGADRIAYIASEPEPEPYLNLFRRPVYRGSSSVWLLDAAAWTSRRVSPEEYPDLDRLLWSRDGSRLAFPARPPGSRLLRAAHPTLYVLTLADGSCLQAASELDLYRGAAGLNWSADDREIWFLNGERMGYNVFAADARTGRLRHVTSGQDCLTELSYTPEFRLAAFVRENSNLKPDIYVTTLPDWRPRRITDLTPQVRHFAWGPGEIIHYPSEGRRIEALLVKPPDFDPGRKYPLILVLHGGPAWYKKNDWRLEWEHHPIQAYAAEGYCLVFPNVRGSADYGVEFRLANFRDLGGGDARDALAAVDFLIRQGFIDESKLGVAGWSYGGFLVPAILTQTDRFKAAQFGAGISSFEAMYSRLSTVEWIIHENYGKRPWEDAQAHIQDSPLYSARKVRTPTLIQHGEDDPRCPVAGAILFYKALKYYGVPAVLEIYPKEGHAILSPLLRRRCLRRNLEWFNKWLKGDRTTSFEALFP